MERPRLVLIDGSGYIFRAFYAISRLSTSKGVPTNAVFGFVNMLIKVLEVEKPEFLAIAFDTAKPTFRKQMFQEYKANRDLPPDDLVTQIPWIHRVVEAFGIESLIKEGFEADDLLGTLAKRAERDGYRVEIITGDKDLMQLVGPNITLFDTMKDRKIDAKVVEERLGVKPDQVVDFLALMGDSSDNIPGVTSIGEKSAAELLKTFGSLQGLYERIGEAGSPKRKEILIREKDIAFLSQKLATVKCDVAGLQSPADFRYFGPDKGRLKALFEELEFQNLLKKFDLVEQAKVTPADYEMVATRAALEKLIAEIRRMSVVSVDTETTSLRTREAKLVGIALATEPLKGYYIPMGHVDPERSEHRALGQMDGDVVRELLKPILEDPKISKMGQNLKYDIQILWGWGVSLTGIVEDTLIASYLLDPERPHNLDALAQRYLNYQKIKYEEVTGKGKNQISFAAVSLDDATRYSAEDAEVVVRLQQKISAELKAFRKLDYLYRLVDLPLLNVLARMEYDGVGVDRARLEGMSSDLGREIANLETSIFKHAGGAFNINSPKQLGEVLFRRLGLRASKRTKTGYSTDESVLAKLQKDHPIAQELIRYRELGKLKSTFVDGLLTEISPVTGRIHTHYNQTVTATGRLSSSNPNLQNIPAAENPNFDVRSVFVSRPGYRLLSADYSQIELRLLAHLSRDRELVAAFKNDEDIHDRTARLIFGVDSVSPEQRKVAKTINFGVMYGQTPFGLSQTLSISRAEAEKFIQAYFERYEGVKTYLHELVEQARSKGFAETLMGRRRFIPELNSKNRMRREMAERAAINAPIQGTAADLIKIAMLNISRQFIDENLDARMILQVHDELVVEASETQRIAVEKVVRECMEGAMSLDVILKVDIGWGSQWRECG